MTRKRALILFGTLTLSILVYVAWCGRCFYLKKRLVHVPDTPMEVRAVFADWRGRTHMNLCEPFDKDLFLHHLSHPASMEDREIELEVMSKRVRDTSESEEGADNDAARQVKEVAFYGTRIRRGSLWLQVKVKVGRRDEPSTWRESILPYMWSVGHAKGYPGLSKGSISGDPGEPLPADILEQIKGPIESIELTAP